MHEVPGRASVLHAVLPIAAICKREANHFIPDGIMEVENDVY